MKIISLTVQETYKPGDLPPEGYLAWHEWAEVQRKAGIKQTCCPYCGKWKTPQELSDETSKGQLVARNGTVVSCTAKVCAKCSERGDDS